MGTVIFLPSDGDIAEMRNEFVQINFGEGVKRELLNQLDFVRKKKN